MKYSANCLSPASTQDTVSAAVTDIITVIPPLLEPAEHPFLPVSLVEMI